MRRLVALAASAAALALAAPGVASAASISGHVTDAGTGAALEETDVVLYDSAGNYRSNAYTAADGSYSFTGLAAGTYKLGYIVEDGSNHLGQFYDGRDSLDTADPVVLATASSSVNGADAALAAGGEIAGTVTAADGGAPLEGVYVTAYDADGDYESSAQTDASGHYTLAGLPTGEHGVYFSTAGSDVDYVSEYYDGHRSSDDADRVAVTAGSVTSGIDATLDPGGRIEGHVADAVTHAAVADVEVDALTPDGDYVGYGYSDDSGDYAIAGLPTGSYAVAFAEWGDGDYRPQYYDGKAQLADADPVAVTEGADTTGIDANLDPGGEITGTVTDADTGEGLDDVQATVYDAAGNWVTYAFTGPSGAYRITGLDAGRYKVAFYDASQAGYRTQYYDGKATLDAADVVTVADEGATTGIDARLTPGGRIGGTVTDAATGEPVAGVMAVAYANGFPAWSALTDSQGHYTIGGLPAGTYNVRFQADPFATGSAAYADEFYDGKASIATADPVAVTDGQLTGNVDAALDPAGKIEGDVVSATGDPVSGLSVEAYDASGNSVVWADTDANGHYVLSGLAAGTYKVGFQPYGSGLDYLPQYYDGKASLADADAVSVTSGQSTQLSPATLQPSGSISGQVTAAADGSPLSGVSVDAYDVATGAYVNGTVTDADGRYTLHGMAACRYKVGFFSTSGDVQYADQYYDARETWSDADPVTVTAGTPTTGIDAAMHAGAAISGTVTDSASGDGLSGVLVTAYGSDGSGVGVYTNADGSYTLRGLAPGTYRVGFSASGGYSTRYYDGKASYNEADPVVAGEGEVVTGIDASLPRGGSIAGTVTDANGDPVAGMSVTVYSSQGGYYGQSQTDASGAYRIGGLPDGDYDVSFSPIPGQNYVPRSYAANPVHVTSGATTGGIDQVVEAGGRIVGTVVDSETGDPIAGVDVSASGDADDGTPYWGSATTDDSGHYAVDRLGTASYSLSFTDSSSHYMAASSSGNLDVTAGQDTLAAPTPMDPAGNVAGTVTDAHDGSAIHDALVTLYRADTGAQVENVFTDASGRYAFGPAAPGDYKVRFQGGGSGAYGTSFYDGKASLEAADAVTIAKRATTQADATLSKRPANTVLPAITGDPRQGQTLTATPGQWTQDPTSVAVQWLRCYSDYDWCWEIAGATARTYTAGRSDVGYRLAVREIATNAGGDGDPAQSAYTGMVIPLPPVAVDAPYITGNAREGEVLSAGYGNWDNGATSYEHQWLQCNAFGSACLAIPGATGDTYTVTAGDVGHTLVVQETAVNAGGSSEPASSAPSPVVVPAVPANLSRPTISGTAKQGGTLTETRGSWSGEPTSYSVQWLRCDADGANCEDTGSYGQSYRPRGADVGHTLVAQEIASNAGGESEPATSLPSDPVVATRPVNTSPPAIAGEPKQGVTLTGDHGAWAYEPDSYSYAWLACPSSGDPCQEIPGATGRTFTPAAEQVGDELVLRVVATNAGGDSQPAYSAQSDPVLAPIPENTSKPTISGTAKEGELLTASHGSWTEDPTAYALQWKRCAADGSCQAIDGATADTYMLTADDVGSRIAVTEVASNDYGAGAAVISAPTGVVVAGPPVNTVLPTISGEAREGSTLGVDPGAWTNSPGSYEYQWLRCSAEAADCAPIDGATATTYAPAADDVGGTVAVAVTAIGSGGRSEPAQSRATGVVVAAEPPDTEITDAPSAVTAADAQDVWFRSEVAGASFECRLGSDEWTPCTSPKTYAGLADGDYAFEVRAKDAAGRVDPSPAGTTWTVDRTAPDTSITGGPSAPVHDGVSFAFDSTEEGGTFECAIDGGQYGLCASGDTLGVATLSPGTHTFHVRARDAAGNVDPTAATSTFTYADEAPQAALDVTPQEGSAELEVQAAVGGSDPEGDGLTYSLDFGDGTVRHGSLPEGGTIAHTYAQAGLYAVRLEVADGHLSDVASRTVTVVLAEPLQADAGDDLVAVAGEPVRLDGTGSRPTAGIDGYDWDFGDGHSGHGASAEHTYATAGDYTATLHVSAGGGDDSDTASIHVVPADAAEGLAVTVTSGGGPVGQADVLVIMPDGRRVAGVTDSAGHVRLHGLADGRYSVLTYAEGYLPKSTPATVADQAGSVSVDLAAGDVARATLTARRLTREEIQELGIDPDDPANQHVSEFTAHFGVDTTFTGWVNDDGLHGDGCTLTRCTFSHDGWTAYFGYADFGSGGSGGAGAHVPGLTELVLPFRTRWLKEFFDVSMTIYNLGDSDFTLRNGQARLNVPPGMSLAPTARGEHATQAFPDVPGGGHASVDWVLRGDEEGEYDLGADYAGTLEPFGHSVKVSAALQEPLKVWGLSALHLFVEGDDETNAHYPFHVRVGLKNVADVPVYNAAIEALRNDELNVIYQPRERYEQSTDQIDPGDTFWADYTVIPDVTGKVTLERSFIDWVAGERGMDPTISTHPAVDTPESAPKLEVVPMKNKLGLRWDPVPGATGYQIYSTSDPKTAFPDHPDPNVEMLPDDGGKMRAVVRNVPDDSSAWYAVSPLIDGRPAMHHPLVSGTPSTGQSGPTVDASYDWPSDSERMCAVFGSVHGTMNFAFADDFFDVTDYTVTVGDTVEARELGIQGSHTASSGAVSIDLDEGRSVVVTVTAHNSDDDTRTWQRTFDTKCEKETAVVVAMGLRSSLDKNGTDSPDGAIGPPCPEQLTGLDGFDQQVAVNACDGVGDRTGNLITYLKSKGYDPGTNRTKPDRTLLEFSYKGADASCTGGAEPTFVPRSYSSGDTWDETIKRVSMGSTATASNYLDALEDYDGCWMLRHGRQLQFTVIGHSLGGYEALALGWLAAQRGDDGLISDIVTVDGAIQPYMVLAELHAADCFLPPDSWLQLPGDLLEDLRDWNPLWKVDNWLEHDNDVAETRTEIRAAQAAGIRVATVTNHDDSCLGEDATINDAADDTAVFHINENGWAGTDAHGAALRSHRDADEDAGFPLAGFLDDRFYVPPHSFYLPLPRGGRRAAGRALAATDAATGRLGGRLHWAGTSTPVADAQVTAVGDGSTLQYVNAQPDGSFSFDALPAGSYKLRVTAVGGDGGGAWVGGPSRASATVFAVQDSGTTDAGDTALTRPVTTSVTVADRDGTPLAGAAAMLLDAGGRQVAAGRTGDDGSVDLVAPAGTYTLAAAAPGHKAASRSVDVAAPGSVRIELASGLDITGTARDASGAPLPEVVVALYDAGGDVEKAGFTNGSGQFAFRGVPAGGYTVHLYEPFGRFDMPAVGIPVRADAGDPSAGQAHFQLGHSPAITSGAPPAHAVLGKPYSFSFTASGDPRPAFSLESGRLPDGLTLHADGTLSGTPRTVGAYAFVVRAASSAGAVVSDAIHIDVASLPAITSGAPPAGRVGTPYRFVVTASGSPTFAVTSGRLPTGLTLDRDGTIHGTPSAAGTFAFTVTATNAAGSAARSLTVRIAGTPVPTPTVTPTPTPRATPTPTPTPQPAADRTAPRVSHVKWPKGRTALATLVKKRRLVIRLTVGERARLASDALLARRTAKHLRIKGKSVKVRGKRYVVLGASKPVTRSGAAKLTVKLSKRSAKRLRHVRKLALVVEVVATDAAGNRRVVRKPVVLRAAKRR